MHRLFSASCQLTEDDVMDDAPLILSLRQTPTFRQRFVARLNTRLSQLEPVQWPRLANDSLALNCLAEEILCNNAFVTVPNPGQLRDTLDRLREVYSFARFDRNRFLSRFETDFLERSRQLPLALLEAGLTTFSETLTANSHIWDIFTRDHWNWRPAADGNCHNHHPELSYLRAEVRRLRLAGFNPMPGASFRDYIFQRRPVLQLHIDSPIASVYFNPDIDVDGNAQFPGFQSQPQESSSMPSNNDNNVSRSSRCRRNLSAPALDFENACLFCTTEFVPAGADPDDSPQLEPRLTFACGHSVGRVCWAAFTAARRRCPLCSGPV
ncbi:hypothetical protein BD289DRAFT_431973 [Coniella lustricola]|uniref:RING-type domain-containing protein n=1 Tax=Coniella lustricola TaxID=2025994 RepID=A0A2T3AAD6_9PEZI|nr:hypothetical protein BD289DRAFT_431973 [Coniella lustricola]